MLPYTPSELIRFIEAAGESSNIDAKGPMEWDGGEASAGLTKDILAFANIRDGGVIVIGKEEVSSGAFKLTGLTSQQANSFDTTKVATWVNNHIAPPVSLVCNRVEHDGKQFIVLTVAEFGDVPVICTRPFELAGKPPKVVLRKGAIYVRTANAESAPLSSIEDLRTLIGLATRKRGQELLTMFESMLKGKPLLALPSDDEKFQAEQKEIEESLGDGYLQATEAGAWQLVVHPSTFRSDRWPDKETLEAIIQRRSVRLRDEFPRSYRGTHMREWGICNDRYHGWWTLARSGQFLCLLPYWENQQLYQCGKRYLDGSPVVPDVEAGGWVDFKPTVFTITEMFAFVARLVEEYERGENVVFSLRATGLAGRVLLTTDFDINLSDPEPCRAGRFQFKKEIPVEEFQADWEDLCAETMKQLLEHFPGPPIALETLRKWIEKFKRREF